MSRVHKLSGSYSKYGGPRESVVKEPVKKVWACQSCGKEQVAEMSPYLYELMPDEYVRVCAPCLNDGCTILLERRKALR